jgi:uncharacterized protein DUF4013
VNTYADAFQWPTRDPAWIQKCLVMGLIGLLAFVPVVGTVIVSLVFYGWTFAVIDNLEAGRNELPPPGFQYLGRGGRPFLVLLIYGIALGIVVAALVVVGSLLLSAGSTAPKVLGGVLVYVGVAVGVVGGLGLVILHPPILLRTYHGGMGAGLNVTALLAEVRVHAGHTVVIGLLAVVANLISRAGSLLCGVGIVLTLAYGYAILGALVRLYELGPTGPTVKTPATT